MTGEQQQNEKSKTDRAKETVGGAKEKGEQAVTSIRRKAALSLAEWTRVYAAIGFLYVLLGAAGWVPFPELSTEVKIALACFLGMPILFWIATAKVVSYLQTILKARVYVIDAEKEEIVRVWEAGLKKAEELTNTAVKGDANKWMDHKGRTCYGVRKFEVENSEYVGSWMGEASDAELFAAKKEIQKNRGRYRYWGEIGFDIVNSFHSIVHAVERNIKAKTLGKEAEYSTKEPKAVIEELSAGVESVDDEDFKAALVGDEKDPRRLAENLTGADLLEEATDQKLTEEEIEHLKEYKQ